MKKTRKITKKMLMNCYGDETFEMCKNISPASALRWLKEVNEFFNKVLGVEKRLQNEKLARKLGW